VNGGKNSLFVAEAAHRRGSGEYDGQEGRKGQFRRSKKGGFPSTERKGMGGWLPRENFSVRKGQRARSPEEGWTVLKLGYAMLC